MQVGDVREPHRPIIPRATEMIDGEPGVWLPALALSGGALAQEEHSLSCPGVSVCDFFVDLSDRRAEHRPESLENPSTLEPAQHCFRVVDGGVLDGQVNLVGVIN